MMNDVHRCVLHISLFRACKAWLPALFRSWTFFASIVSCLVVRNFYTHLYN